MAYEIRIQSRARTDIVELAVYIGRDSVLAANEFLGATDETFALLALHPFLGAEYRTRNPRLKGVRVLRVKKQPMLPKLAELEKQLLAHREAKGLQPQIDLVGQTMAAIKADKHPPKLRSMGDT